MAHRTLSQQSFFDPEFVCPDCLEPGSLAWLLARYRSRLFPAWLTRGWRGEGRRGRRAWPATVLLTLVLLRWSEEGMSRRASCRRGRTDVSWRAALGLRMDAPTPNEKTVREFEEFLRARHQDVDVSRFVLLFEHIVRVCLDTGVVGARAVWATDSTPMWCYGAVQDTVRLLGDGMRSLAKSWSKATGTSMEELARHWQLPLLLACSTKGAFRIDWKKSAARDAVVSELAGTVLRVTREVLARVGEVRSSKRKGLMRRCRSLLRVVRDDLESDEQGRLVVAQKVTTGRLVSITDPQARHGRKSNSKRFNGYKVHVLGDVVSGVIASLSVTAGNVHDGSPAARLIKRAKVLCDDIERVLADTAYGSATLRVNVKAQTGVTLLAPPVMGQQRNNGKLKKDDFSIDFERVAAICPRGVESRESKLTWQGGHPCQVRRFLWPAQSCNDCPKASLCPTVGRGRHGIVLHPHEQVLREARQQWKDPAVREAYRTRTQCERLVNEMTRHGARRARSWGLKQAEQQAYLVATRCNLGKLAKVLAEKEKSHESVVMAA